MLLTWQSASCPRALSRLYSLFTDADLKSLWAFQAASARLLALREPDPAVCLRLKFDTNGAIIDYTTPDSVIAKLLEGVRDQQIRQRIGPTSRRRGSAFSLYSQLRRGSPGTGT